MLGSRMVIEVTSTIGEDLIEILPVAPLDAICHPPMTLTATTNLEVMETAVVVDLRGDHQEGLQVTAEETTDEDPPSDTLREAVKGRQVTIHQTPTLMEAGAPDSHLIMSLLNIPCAADHYEGTVHSAEDEVHSLDDLYPRPPIILPLDLLPTFAHLLTQDPVHSSDHTFPYK